MRAPLLLAFAATSLALVGYAVYSLQAPPAARVRSGAASTPATAPSIAEPAALQEPPIQRIARAAAASAEPPADERAYAAEPEPPPEPEPAAPPAVPVTRQATEAAFDALMTELEAIPSPRALNPERRAELYRATNDTFAALTIQLGEDESEAIEDAYMRVQAQVGRLRLRGKP
ncbi:MAG: hypothetical protein R3B09_29715 [Nannocystaceae bacterium]